MNRQHNSVVGNLSAISYRYKKLCYNLPVADLDKLDVLLYTFSLNHVSQAPSMPGFYPAHPNQFRSQDTVPQQTPSKEDEMNSVPLCICRINNYSSSSY